MQESLLLIDLVRLAFAKSPPPLTHHGCLAPFAIRCLRCSAASTRRLAPCVVINWAWLGHYPSHRVRNGRRHFHRPRIGACWKQIVAGTHRDSIRHWTSRATADLLAARFVPKQALSCQFCRGKAYARVSTMVLR